VTQPATSGYTVDDFPWLRSQLGVSHLELDPWGSLIVTPGSDEHEMAISFLAWQAMHQGFSPADVSTGFTWKVPDGSGYLNTPDLTILAPGWRRMGENHVDPAPLVVVEVASRSTVRVDRVRKRDDYRLGGAGLYVRVDFFEPGRAGFEVHEFASDEIKVATTAVDLVVGGHSLRFDLTELPRG